MARQRFTGLVRHSERGISLPLALVALAFGVLLLTPLLSHVSTNLEASQAVDDNLQEQYASDAGVEYGIWKLEHDTGFRDLVEAAGHTGVTVTLPSQVNSLDPVVRVVDAGQELEYALWGNSLSCETNIDWAGTGIVVNGNVHTNSALRVRGESNTFNGAVTYHLTEDVHPTTIFIPPRPDNLLQTYVQEMPIEWHMSDYDNPAAVGTPAHAADGLGQYHYIDGDLDINVPEDLTDGLYYVTGEIHINSNNLTENVTFVARDLILVNGTNLAFTPYCDQLTFFTDLEGATCDQAVLKIVANGNTTLGGVCYAPNGQISMNGEEGSISGSFLGDSIDLRGTDLIINLPPSACEPHCTAYDVLSEAGETSTTARVWRCEGESEVRVLSWWLE